MADKLKRAQFGVAVIGVGRNWETHYRDVVRRMSAKLSVRAVCDAVHARAVSVAEEFHATAYSSPWQLARRRDLEAWLIFDPGWFGLYPAELVVQRRVPALLANPFVHEMSRLQALVAPVGDCSDLLVPEFPNRFAPATTRIRELLATKLGPVREIQISVPFHCSLPLLASTNSLGEPGYLSELHGGRAYLLSLFDWCVCLFGRHAASVSWRRDEFTNELQLHFPHARNEATHPESFPTSATITFQAATAGELPPHRRRVNCERGVILCENPNQVVWNSESECADETLNHERSPFEIILDQFCRRAAGGLIPVPSRADASHALQLLFAAIDSFTQQTPILVK